MESKGHRAAGLVALGAGPAIPANRRPAVDRAGPVMTVHRQRNGRFRARLKSGRMDVASKTFDTKREAEQWLARERAALARGIDPRAGQQRIRALLQPWLASRRTTVAAKT